MFRVATPFPSAMVSNRPSGRVAVQKSLNYHILLALPLGFTCDGLWLTYVLAAAAAAMAAAGKVNDQVHRPYGVV